MQVKLRPQRAVHRPIWAPYVFLGALQVLDVVTTYTILRWFAEGRTEGNPVAAAILGTVGLAVGCIILLTFKASTVWLFWACQTKVRIVNAIYGVVILNNLLLLTLAVLK